MSAALHGAVELLERALGYTRVTLGDVRPDLHPDVLGRPTPCAAWRLDRLLSHMEDALDAFTEAAAGLVVVDTPPPVTGRVETLRDKACALLGAWARAADEADRAPGTANGVVRVGDAALVGPVLVATAALEVAVHGWDVGQATGARVPLPVDLAAGLLPVAERLVTGSDRGHRFGPRRPVAADAPADVRLLAFLGREPTGPAETIGKDPGNPGTARGVAS